MKFSKIGLGLLLAVVMLMGMAGMGWGMGGSPPPLVNFQGRLINNSDGKAVAGTTQVKFSFYDNENVGSGTKLPSGSAWEETYTATEMGIDENGVINAVLGSKVAIPYSTLFMLNQPIYLNVDVGGETLSAGGKRQRMVTTPFAFVAHSVNGSENIVYASRTGAASMPYAAVSGIRTAGSVDESAGVFGNNQRTTAGLNPGIQGESTSGYGVWAKGVRGVAGFDIASTIGDTGTYGLLGGNPLTITSGYTYKVGAYGQAGLEKRGILGFDRRRTSDGGDATEAGVYGTNTSTDGYGVYGKSSGTATTALPGLGAGIYGLNNQTTIPSGRIAAPGVYGESTNGIGVYGTGKLGGIQGKLSSDVNINGKLGGTDTATIIYEENGTLDLWITGTDLVKKYGAFGQLNSTTFGALGFKQTGTSVPDNEYGVYGQTNTKYAAIKGLNSKVDIAGDDLNPGVMGVSFHGAGVYGLGLNGSKYAIYAKTSGVNAGDAIRAEITTSGNIRQAIWGTTAGTGAGVMGGSMGGAGVVGASYGNDTSTAPTANYPGKAIYALADGLAATNQVVYFGKITNTADGSHAKYLAWLQTGNNRKFSVDSNGNVWSATRVYGAAYHSKNADIAEWIKASEKGLEAGDVVVFDANNAKQIKMSDGSYSRLVAGVISTNPSFLGNYSNEVMGEVTENKEKRMEEMGNVKLAIAGQVPCKVTAENGAIEIGDLLTTSNVAGYAMKAADPKIGTILGKAMEPLASGKGKIMVLLTLQ